MVVEGAFGILAHRWRVFDRRLPLSTDNADKVITSCCVPYPITSQRTKISVKLFQSSTQRDVSMEMAQLFCGYLD